MNRDAAQRQRALRCEPQTPQTPQTPQARHLNGIRDDDDAPGALETAQAALLAVGVGDPTLPTPFARVFARSPADEMRAGMSQLAPCFLRRTRGDLVHPRAVGVLARVPVAVPVAVPVHGRWTRSASRVRVLLARQPPMVGVASRARRPLAGGHVRVIQGKFRFVGALDAHQVVLFPLSRSVHAFRLLSHRE